jgi:carotenoid cleavage dioxygenase-like enzyme
MVHDFVVTKNYAVIPIFPLKMGLQNGFDSNGKSKFAVIPRYCKDSSQIIWLEFEPCFTFHYANAWEDDSTGEIIVVGCPLPKGFALERFSKKDANKQKPDAGQPASHRFTKWTLNISDKTVKSEVYFEGTAEFPTINPAYATKKSEFAYLALKSKDHEDPLLGLDAVRKVNLSTGSTHSSTSSTRSLVYLHLIHPEYNDYVMPEGFTIGEWFFVPRPKSRSEDDGYLFTFAHDYKSSASQLIILDALELSLVARVKTPQRVPAGFHGTWVTSEQIAGQILDDY